MDLIEVAVCVDPVGLSKLRKKIAPVALAVALGAGISIEKRRQYPGVGIVRTSKRETLMLLNVVRDTVFAVLQSPLMQTVFRIVDVAVEDLTMIGDIHDLANRRASALRQNAKHHAFAVVIQAPGKPIFLGSLVVRRAHCAALPTQPKPKGSSMARLGLHI